MKQLLLNAVSNKNYEERLKNVLAVYGYNLDIITLTNKLESVKINFSSGEHSITSTKTFPVISREHFSQVIVLLKILLVMPATNVVNERSVSNLHRIKNWLRTSMTQKNLIIV